MNKEEFNAMSLPYNLKVMNIVDKSIHEVIGIDSCLCFIFKDNFWQTNGHTYTKNIPILRPLSELTKEIEHNGEKFVPIEKLNHTEIDIKIIISWINSDLLILKNSLRLVEWHFDIAGLIDKNEAVDYTTLESFSF